MPQIWSFVKLPPIRYLFPDGEPSGTVAGAEVAGVEVEGRSYLQFRRSPGRCW